MATSTGESENTSGDSNDVVSESDEQAIVINGTNDMICAKCFTKGENKGAIGICKECKFYLCGGCVVEHRKSADFRSHPIAYFYCAQKLKVNKYVLAESFCLDCGQYLCKKCVMDHRGFREYRNHSFIGGKAIPKHEMSDDLRATGLKKGPPKRDLNRRSNLNLCREQSNLSTLQRERSTLEREKSIVIRQTERNRQTDKIRQRERLTKPPAPIKVKQGQSQAQALHIDESSPQPRTLINSTVGRRPATEKTGLLSNKSNKRQRPKTVSYSDERVTKSATPIGEFIATTPTDDVNCNIIAAVFLGTDQLVLADYGNKKVKLYGNDFKLISSLDIENLPLAICGSPETISDFYASTGSQILQVNTSKRLNVVQTFETEIECIEGITPWAFGIGAVFRSTKSKYDKLGHWEIHLLNTEGVVKYQIVISSHCPVKLDTPIWYIGSTQEGNEIFISDTSNNRIVCVDIVNWHVVYVLKGRDMSGSPRSLATDADGNVLVTWYNEVHVIQSKTGADLGVPISGIGKNAIIAYNKRTNCLVVHEDKKAQTNKFQVYQLCN